MQKFEIQTSLFDGMYSITHSEAIAFLLPRHYSGRKPNIKYAFGWFYNSELVAVCTFGIPASRSLCVGVCGEENAERVIELNRLCRVSDLKQQLSQFVSYCLKWLKQFNYIIVSYSDKGMNHNGYIYQACNFLYTGCTKERTDKYTEGNKHSRHYDNSKQDGKRKVRTSKNRYVYFACDKRFKKKFLKQLNYTIMEYPKDENQNYQLGEFQQSIIIEKESGI